MIRYVLLSIVITISFWVGATRCADMFLTRHKRARLTWTSPPPEIMPLTAEGRIDAAMLEDLLDRWNAPLTEAEITTYVIGGPICWDIEVREVRGLHKTFGPYVMGRVEGTDMGVLFDINNRDALRFRKDQQVRVEGVILDGFDGGGGRIRVDRFDLISQ